MFTRELSALLLGLSMPCFIALCSPTARAGGDLTLSTELLAGGFAMPVFATAPDGDAERIFVVEQFGKIKIIDRGVVLPDPFLDISGLVTAGGERGLLSLAFHPSYSLNGRLFVYYNDLVGDATVAEYAVDPGDENLVLPGSGQVLLSMPKPFVQHNGGTLAFSPIDEMLWISVGDGGSSGDPFNNAQNTSTLLGSLLRIDVSGPPPYSIPSDNPFVGVPGAREEIYAYGLRNPYRFSMDRIFGDVWIGDVGQQGKEEIDLIRLGQAGLNFGWRCLEGSDCTGYAGCDCPLVGATAPAIEYDHNVGCAVIGGYVYRGSDIPGLAGHYFYADFCTSQVWSVDKSSPSFPDPIVDRTLELSPPAGTLGFVAGFGQDGRGELLIVSYTGDVRRIIQAEPDPDCDGDGVSDVDELLAGTVPDSCELLLTGSTLVYGQPAQLDFIGSDPGQVVVWFATLRGIGPGPCFFGGALCLDLLPFLIIPSGEPQVFLLAITTADAMGHAGLSFVVPASGLQEAKPAFQAIKFAGAASEKSNPIQKVVQKP